MVSKKITFIPLTSYSSYFKGDNFLWRPYFSLKDFIRYFFLRFLPIKYIPKNLNVYYPYSFIPPYHYLLKKLFTKGFRLHIVPIETVSGAYAFNVISSYPHIKSTGCDIDPNKAVSKALGEYLERMVISQNSTSCIYESYIHLIDLYEHIYYPPLFHKNNDSDNKLIIQSKNHKHKWVVGSNLIDKQKAVIPYEVAFLTASETYMPQPTTNGCAGFFTKDGAILRATLEVIERDSFLVHWLTKITPPVFSMSSIPHDITSRIMTIVKQNIEVIILNITTNINIPSVCMVLKTKKYNGKITISGGAGVTYREALLKALEEAFTVTDFFSRQGTVYERETFFSSKKVIDKEERTHLWQGEAWLKDFEWFLSGELVTFPLEETIFTHDGDRLHKVCSLLSLQDKRYWPIIYEYKNELLSSLGFHVVRSCIPLAIPFFLDERRRPCASKRLEEFAALKGVFSFTINTLPHPFP